MSDTTQHPGHGLVLVVDDDPDMRGLLDDFLAGAGYAVAQVPGAAEAVTFLEEHDVPCAILVDMRMPGIVGSSLLQYLRHEPRLTDVPVAVVSGSPQLAPAGYRVFSKPIDPDQLLSFVRDRCQRRAAPARDGNKP